MTQDSRLETPDSSQTPDSTQTPDLCGIVLAAGQSSRMGAFKPLLPFGNKTVIDHCVDNLHEAGIGTIVVVVGHRGEVLRRHLQGASVMFAVNPDPTSAMSVSIALGLGSIPSDAKAVVIIPVDHPAVSAEIISSLIQQWEEGAQLVVPTWNQRGGHPVVIDLKFREELLTLDEQRGLKGLLDAHQDLVKRVPVGSSYIARDMDTWDDYRDLHEDVFGVPPPNPA